MSQEITCARVYFLLKLQGSALQLHLKKTLAQMFSCEFCEIFKNTFFTEHLLEIASEYGYVLSKTFSIWADGEDSSF